MGSFFYNHRYLVRRPKERKRQYKSIIDERTGKWRRVEIVPKPKPEYIQRMQYIMNLELNFVYNQDMIAGSYENALLGFNNVIKVRPDHAIAYYFGAICHKHLGNMDKYKSFKSKFEKFSGHEDWSTWIEFFGLKDLEAEPGNFVTEPSLTVALPNSC